MRTIADLTGFWFTGGHVVDVRGGTVRRDMNVEIVADISNLGGRIVYLAGWSR